MISSPNVSIRHRPTASALCTVQVLECQKAQDMTMVILLFTRQLHTVPPWWLHGMHLCACYP